MLSQVSVKHKAPALVRLYNFFLLILSKTHLIDCTINKNAFLKKLNDNTSLIIRNALSRFIDNVNTNDLNPATQLFIKGELSRTLSNRIKIANILSNKPSLKENEFLDPIFIIGLRRTGTTALQNIFSFLSDYRVLKLWELHYPTSSLEGDLAIKKAKHQTKKYSFLQNFSKPEQKYIHPVGTEHPDECFRLLFNSFTSIAISSALGLDDYEKWILEIDMVHTYEEYKKQLRILSQKSLKKHLVLKAPEHLWHLDSLLQVFPKARIIMTHRDPLKSIASYASMISMFRRTAYKKSNFEELGQYVASVFEKGLSKVCLLRKDKTLEDRIVDVHCNDIKNNPVKVLMTIDKALKTNIKNKDLNNLNKRFNDQLLDYNCKHNYSYSKYGINKKLIEKKFEFYNHQKYMML